MEFLYSTNIENMRRNPRFEYANIFLDKLLNKELFDTREDALLLDKLFSHLGSNSKDAIRKALLDYIYPSYLNDVGRPRILVESGPQDIMQARLDLQRDDFFLRIQNDVLSSRLPDKRDLEYFYGDFAEDSLNTIKRFSSPSFLRVCGIPKIAHWMRVGGTVKKINNTEFDSFRRAYSAFKHDDVEEGIPIAGLENYFEYLQSFIPEQIREEVILLTNHYDMYLNSAKEDFIYKKLDPNKKMLINSIKKLRKMSERKLVYVDKIIFALMNSGSEIVDGPGVIDSAKNYFYEKHYLPELVSSASIANKLFIVEDKCVDLLDNDNGSKKIPLGKYIKNITKQWSMVNVAENINSDYVPFKRKTEELKNNAVLKTRYLLLGDILEKDMTLDFIYSTSGQILSKLKPVIFEQKIN